MTLGTLLLIFAVVDLTVCVLLGMALARRQQEMPTAQQGPAPLLVVGAGVGAFIFLCVLAISLPQADRVIL